MSVPQAARHAAMLPAIGAPIALHPQPDVDAFTTGLLLGRGAPLHVEGAVPDAVRELARLHAVPLLEGRPDAAFLVDHAERPGWNIVGAMDHHPLRALPPHPLLWAPLGACTTLAWLATRDVPRSGLERETALRAIVADTALFRSSRSTALDEALARELGDPLAAARWVFRLREPAPSLRRTHAKRFGGVDVVSVEYLEWEPVLEELIGVCQRDGAVLLLGDVARGESLVCHDHPQLRAAFPAARGRHRAPRLLSRSLDIAPLLLQAPGGPRP